jgi:hypothetical protein
MEKKQAGLERIKKLEEQIAKKRAELIRQKGRLSEKDRRARTRKLIQVGGLADIAGLLEADHGFLLGVLLNASEISLDSERWKTTKLKGDILLKERDAARKKSVKKEG